jgi:hypothetical protein
MKKITLEQFMIEKQKYNTFFYANSVDGENISKISNKSVKAVWYQIIFDNVTKINKKSTGVIEFSLSDNKANLIIFSPISFIQKQEVNKIETRYFFNIKDCNQIIEILAVKKKNHLSPEHYLNSIRSEVITSMNAKNIDFKDYILHSENITNSKYLAALHNKNTNNCILIECDIGKNDGAVIVTKF